LTTSNPQSLCHTYQGPVPDEDIEPSIQHVRCFVNIGNHSQPEFHFHRTAVTQDLTLTSDTQYSANVGRTATILRYKSQRAHRRRDIVQAAIPTPLRNITVHPFNIYALSAQPTRHRTCSNISCSDFSSRASPDAS